MLRAWKVLGPGCEYLRPFLGAGIRNRFEKPAKDGLRIGPAPEQTFHSALHVSCGEHCYVMNFSYLPLVKLVFFPLLPHLNPSQTQDSSSLSSTCWQGTCCYLCPIPRFFWRLFRTFPGHFDQTHPVGDQAFHAMLVSSERALEPKRQDKLLWLSAHGGTSPSQQETGVNRCLFWAVQMAG